MSKTDSSSTTKSKVVTGAVHRDERATTPGTDDEATVGPICENFAPQTWRKTICRNCFHAKSEHGWDTRTNGTENLANSADARKTTSTPSSKKEDEKERSSDKNVSSTTEKTKNAAHTAPGATVKQETKNTTTSLAALLSSNQPKKSPHLIPNATPVSLIMSNLANTKKTSPVDVKKCGPPGNTLLSTASAKKLAEKFGGSKSTPPSPSGLGSNKIPVFGKKINSIPKETSKPDSTSPGTKQVAQAAPPTKSPKTPDVVATSAGTTSTPSSSLSSTSSSPSTTKTTNAVSNKDTSMTKDTTIDTKKSSSDSSSTATTTSKTATATATAPPPTTTIAITTKTATPTATTKTTTTTTTTITAKPSTTTSDSANEKSKVSNTSTTPTSTKTSSSSSGETSKSTCSAKGDTTTASSKTEPSSSVTSKGQVGISSPSSTTSTTAIQTPVVTVAATDGKNGSSEKNTNKAKTRSPSPSFLSSPLSPSPPSPTPSSSLAAPSLGSSTKSTTTTTTTPTTTPTTKTTTTTTAPLPPPPPPPPPPPTTTTTAKPSLTMPPSPSSPSSPLSPSSPIPPSTKTTTATQAKPTSAPSATNAIPATSVQPPKSTQAATTTQKGVSPTVSKTTTTTSDKTTTTAVTATTTTPTPPPPTTTTTPTATTKTTTTTSTVPSPISIPSTPAISTKPITQTGGITTTVTTKTTAAAAAGTKTTDSNQTTKTVMPPTSLGTKFSGQLTDTSVHTSPIPKVKTMVVESSKYAKSQAEAAAAAAAAEAAATAAAIAVAATTPPTPTSTSTTAESTKEEIADYIPRDYGDNMTSIRRTSRNTDDPNVGSTRAFTSATPEDVKSDGQRCTRSHSFEGSNVIITSGQDIEGARDSPGRLSRQDSTSSTSSSSESGRSRQPIVVEVQVRKGHRSSQQASQPTGRTPSPAPFVVISPSGTTRIGRTPITTTIRTGYGFPAGRMSPTIIHSGFSGIGGYIDGGSGERSWDSGGGSFVSSPTPSSCSSPTSSSMRSGYRPYQSPSPSPSPNTPARVIPLPVLHTTSTGVSPDSYEFNVARATSPHIAGYHTPPPPPYTPPLDTPTTQSRTSSSSPSQQLYSPGHSNIQDSKISGSHYLKDVDCGLDARFDPNNFENKPKHEGGKSRDIFVIDNRITHDRDNQQVQSNTYEQQVSGYSPSASQQQAKSTSIKCHRNETNIDASQPSVAAAAAAAVSRYPGKDNITLTSPTDAVVSPSSPAASTAVAAPPASISNEGRQEAYSLKAVPYENRDQEPRKSYHETPDDPSSKSKSGHSRSPAEILPSETNRGPSFEEVEKIKSKVTELEESIQKLKDENSKLKNDLNEKSTIEKQVADYTETLKTMEKKCSDLEEDKTELEDQVQIEKMKVAKGQLESRSLAELRKLLEESDITRNKLNEENYILREEVNEMKLEVDEMYDQFRESDAEDFRELQKELEITAKNCRILQFKLRKAERRNDQIETEREHYEEKLRNLQDAFESQDARRHIQALEEELKMAKEVSVRLHDELDIVEEKRSRVEDDNRKLQDMLELSDKKNFRMEMEIDKLRDKVADLQSAIAKLANCTQDTSSNRKV